MKALSSFDCVDACSWLRMVCQEKEIGFQEDQWTLVGRTQRTPHQGFDSVDCGVYAIVFCWLFLKGVDPEVRDWSGCLYASVR
jgi:hypothetical protein